MSDLTITAADHASPEPTLAVAAAPAAQSEAAPETNPVQDVIAEPTNDPADVAADADVVTAQSTEAEAHEPAEAAIAVSVPQPLSDAVRYPRILPRGQFQF